MTTIRYSTAGIICAAVLILCSYQFANAYSNDAAPAPASPSTPVAASDSSVASAAAAASTTMDPAKTIFENISSAPNFSTLSDALKATGLDATLSAPGPKVLFAPDNGAFAKLSPGQVEDLMKPENSAKLARILNYHIVSGKLTEHDIESLMGVSKELALKTMEGSDIAIEQGEGVWMVTDGSGGKAKITTDQDIPQSNGSIYTIDTVLMPKM